MSSSLSRWPLLATYLWTVSVSLRIWKLRSSSNSAADFALFSSDCSSTLDEELPSESPALQLPPGFPVRPCYQVGSILCTIWKEGSILPLLRIVFIRFLPLKEFPDTQIMSSSLWMQSISYCILNCTWKFEPIQYPHLNAEWCYMNTFSPHALLLGTEIIASHNWLKVLFKEEDKYSFQ